MTEFDKSIKKNITKETLEVPSYVSHMIDDTLENLPEKEYKLQQYGYQKKWIAVAAVLSVFLLVFMPNINVTYAQTLENVPIIGDIVKIFTIHKDIYEDGKHELQAEIPMVNDDKNQEEATLMNKDIEQLSTAVIQKFYEEIELSKDGYGSIYLDYEVIMNNASWFSLKLNVNEIAGSSDSYAKIYHIDRINGRYVQLKDLLNEDGMKEVEAYILKTMQSQMEQDKKIEYVIENDFKLVTGESNFYYNENMDLVIVYNKYEIAPGYMGCPEFIIPKDIYECKIIIE